MGEASVNRQAVGRFQPRGCRLRGIVRIRPVTLTRSHLPGAFPIISNPPDVAPFRVSTIWPLQRFKTGSSLNPKDDGSVLHSTVLFNVRSIAWKSEG